MSSVDEELTEIKQLQEMSELMGKGYEQGGPWWRKKVKEISERHSGLRKAAAKDIAGGGKEKGPRKRFRWIGDTITRHKNLKEAASFESFGLFIPNAKDWKNDHPRGGHANVYDKTQLNYRRCKAVDNDGKVIHARVVDLNENRQFLYQEGTPFVYDYDNDDDDDGDDDDDDEEPVPRYPDLPTAIEAIKKKNSAAFAAEKKKKATPASPPKPATKKKAAAAEAAAAEKKKKGKRGAAAAAPADEEEEEAADGAADGATPRSKRSRRAGK